MSVKAPPGNEPVLDSSSRRCSFSSDYFERVSGSGFWGVASGFSDVVGGPWSVVPPLFEIQGTAWIVR